jgi:hypothetical protein
LQHFHSINTVTRCIGATHLHSKSVTQKRSSDRQDLLHGAAVGNTALDLCLPRLGALRLERLHNVHALDYLAKHDVAPVEPGGLDRGDEELGSVGPGAGYGVFRQSEGGQGGCGDEFFVCFVFVFVCVYIYICAVVLLVVVLVVVVMAVADHHHLPLRGGQGRCA